MERKSWFYVEWERPQTSGLTWPSFLVSTSKAPHVPKGPLTGRNLSKEGRKSSFRKKKKKRKKNGPCLFKGEGADAIASGGKNPSFEKETTPNNLLVGKKRNGPPAKSRQAYRRETRPTKKKKKNEKKKEKGNHGKKKLEAGGKAKKTRPRGCEIVEREENARGTEGERAPPPPS